MFYSKVLAVLGIGLYLVTACTGASILFYFGLSTYSHRISVWPLAVKLAESGHSVSFLQPGENKNPHPKIKDIRPADTGLGSMDLLAFRMNYGPKGTLLLGSKLPQLGESTCKSLLDDPDMVSWINSSKFDLVIIDSLYNDCGYGLAHKWGAKTAIFSTSSSFEWFPDAYGFFAETNWIGSLHYGQDLPLPFFGRLLSTLITLGFRYSMTEMMLPKLEAMLRDKLNMPDMPDIVDLEANTSLILVNTHFSEEFARSLPPLVVSVGGMHCEQKAEPLPKDIEAFINGSGKDGFLYVSFGSGAQISKGSKELQDKFFKAFKNFGGRVLWKWEADRPAEMPSNVYTANWLPQQAILAHPKIRGFITHSGLLSIQEALFNAVPMISFPIFAEQSYNAERLHRTKRGIRLEITEFTQKDLEDAMKQLLNNKIYSERVKKDSILFKDRPQTPVDTAQWWVEYVLRHDDLSHLRPLSINQTWYQRRLLDVWLFILVVVLIVVYIFIRLVRSFFRLCFGHQGLEQSAKAKKIKTK